MVIGAEADMIVTGSNQKSNGNAQAHALQAAHRS
jgi:hypothetical protein